MCTKRRFYSPETAALSVIGRSKKEKCHKRWASVKYAYKCRECGFWHLTRQCRKTSYEITRATVERALFGG